MADYVKTIILRDTPEFAQVLLCGASDGTGESNVRKIDLDATFANFSPTKTRIRKLQWSIIGQSVELLYDHTTPQTIALLCGNGSMTDEHEAPIQDNGSAGGTGDVMLTTHVAQATGSHYTIFIELQKVA